MDRNRIRAAGAIAFLVLAVGVLGYRWSHPGSESATEQEATRSPAEARRQEQAESTRRAELAVLKAEEELSAQLRAPARRRWTVLPPAIQGVQVDSSGRAWFEGSGVPNFSQRWRETVEAAHAGRTSIIGSHALMLVDRQGRFWLGGNSLRGYDGRKWEERQPLPNPRGEQTKGWFEGRGWEDTAGNLYFINHVYDYGYAIHRRSAAGEWTAQLVVEARDWVWQWLPTNSIVVEQAGGRMAICRPSSADSSGSDSSPVLHFDGTSWQRLQTRICAADHMITGLVPFPDGSIGTFCSDRRLWVYWPDSVAAPAGKNIDGFLVDLDDPAVAKRDRATKALAAMGAGIAPHLRQVLEAGASPEAQARISAILRSFQNVAADAAQDTHNRGQLYGGRFEFQRCNLVTRPGSRHIWLYVEECRDVTKGELHKAALIRIDPAGQWSLVPIPTEQWAGRNWSEIPQEAMEDSKGRLWLEAPYRLNASAEIERATPLELGFKQLIGEDKDGRFFFLDRNGWLLMLDESVPEAKPELKEEVFTYRAMARNLAARSTWGTHIDGSPQFLLRFREGSWRSVATPFDGELLDLVHLKEGRLIVSCGKGEQTRAGYFDGTTWHVEESVDALLRRHIDSIRPFANDFCRPESGFCLAANDLGHVWCGSTWDRSRPMRYYDGREWHDVGEELAKQGVWLKYYCFTADRGRSMLAHDVEQRRIWITWEGGRLRTKPIKLPPSTQDRWRVEQYVVGPEGEVWVVGLSSKPRDMGYFKDGEIHRAPWTGLPLLADSKGRIWSLEKAKLQVKAGQQWAEAAFPGLEEPAAMAESSDGRLWLLTLENLVQVEAEGEGGLLAVREVGRWSWPYPRNLLIGSGCDDTDGLWFGSGEWAARRVTLPQSKAR